MRCIFQDIMFCLVLSLSLSLSLKTTNVNDLDLIDFPPNVCMTQGRFIAGSHAEIKTYACVFQKVLGPFGILRRLRC